MEAGRVSGAAAGLAIDWQAPWMAPYLDLRPQAESLDWRAALTQAAARRGVRTAGGRPLQFVAADDAGSIAYEAHIAATGRVPSRDNAHDLFNALVWLAFPQTKAALNARQAEEIARDGVRDRRGPVRDAATLIDESGLLLAADGEACAALARLDWPWLFGAQRARWRSQWRPFAFGHALLEKLRAPYKRLTAAVVCLPLADENPGHADAAAVGATPVAIDAGRVAVAGAAAAVDTTPATADPEAVEAAAIEAARAAIDAAAARWVRETPLSPKRLSHLPVLGIPGWWPANESPQFYDDADVFRLPHRVASPACGGAHGAAAPVGQR